MNRKQLAFLPDDIDCRPLVRATPPVITPAPPFMMVDYHHKDEDPWSKTMNYGSEPISLMQKRRTPWPVKIVANVVSNPGGPADSFVKVNLNAEQHSSRRSLIPPRLHIWDEPPTQADLLDIAVLAKRYIGVRFARNLTCEIGFAAKLNDVQPEHRKDLYNAFRDAIKQAINEGKEPTS